MKFPEITEADRVAKLAPPEGRVRMVLDTDTYNEIDDQYAVVYSLLAPEKLDVQALYAAPFDNSRSDGPADGMEKSHEEILRVISRLDVKPDGLVFKGSTSFLPAADQPVESAAAADLIKKAHEEGDGPLYVAAIGAITNVASAILMDPSIIEKIVVIWLGGNPLYWSSAHEFNLKQDPHASRLVFDCGVPLVHVPCMNVAEMLRTTKAEMAEYVNGRGAIGDYLYQIYCDFVPDKPAHSKVIWDIAAIAWLLNPQAVPTELVHSPILTDQLTYSVDTSRHLIRSVIRIDRDWVFGDLFARITLNQNKFCQE
ncbi:nucleoside hydrolase [Planctomycetota bacterium]